MDNRPTFFLNSNPELEIRAGGIIFITKDKSGNVKLLLREYKGHLSDIGGKTDEKDKNIFETIIREVCEETNNHLFSKKHNFHICRKILHSIIRKQRPKRIYNKDSKYLLLIVRLKPSIVSLPMERFGQIERESGLKHNFFWYKSLPEFSDIHPRLKRIYPIINSIIDKI